MSVDRTELPPHIVGDLDAELAALGAVPARWAGGQRRAALSAAPPGMPGRPGRGYWVMRTSPWERPFLWAEAQAGRLRQGWGTFDEQNLAVVADAVSHGRPLTDRQRETRRALRMLTSWPGGVRLGDAIVAPHLPNYGRLSVYEVSGSYEWLPAPPLKWGERFGHVLPVKTLIRDVFRWDSRVTDALRGALRNQTRLYSIKAYGGDVEVLLGNTATPVDRRGESWTEAEYESLFTQFPPDGAAPTELEANSLALEFGRTSDAVTWQWQDGAGYVQGRSASTTSDVLKLWLDIRYGHGGHPLPGE
jgi:hypothetical protein